MNDKSSFYDIIDNLSLNKDSFWKLFGILAGIFSFIFLIQIIMIFFFDKYQETEFEKRRRLEAEAKRRINFKAK